MKKISLIVIAIFFVLVVILMLAGKKTEVKKQATFETSSSRDVALLCTSDMATQFHIHPTIRIMIDSVEYPLPENIGITETCMHSIHTHHDMPVVHIEAPMEKDFTLGDFFAVWDHPFDSEHLLDKTTDATHVISVSVNGVPVDTFENTVMHDKDAIVISYEKTT